MIVILTLVVSLVEALIILPAHLAHSKALQPLDASSKQGMAAVFSKLRGFNAVGEKIMNTLRDKMYAPVLLFSLRHKIFTFSVFLIALILTLGSVGGGVVKTAFFPRIASDRVSISLVMPNGTNEQITDSIISMIAHKSEIVNQELTAKYLNGTDKILFENIIKTIGPGASRASIEINLLPGEERPDAIRSDLVTTRLAELVGPVLGVEQLIYGSGGNFGGSPVSVSLLGNNIEELKGAKASLKKALLENDLLKDVVDNDPAGIKEIRLSLKDNAYALGLDVRTVMAQVRSGFLVPRPKDFKEGKTRLEFGCAMTEKTAHP